MYSNYLETKRLLSSADDETAHQEERNKLSMHLALLCMFALFSTQNVMAPNLTAIANTFGFSEVQRDEYIGGQLTMFFFFSGLLSGLLFGLLSALYPRLPCLFALTAVTGAGCLLGGHLSSYGGLIVVRVLCGWGLGGALPLMYSMLGDFLPVQERTLGSAYVTMVCGFGIFFGQMVGALMGASDWRTPFVVLAFVCFACAGATKSYGREPGRGANDPVSQAHQRLGEQYKPVTSFAHIRKTVFSTTNMVIWAQAFPGNVPWGIALVFLNDFMLQDLQLSMSAALASINVLALFALLGNLTGGVLGKYLHTQPKWMTPLAATSMCILRCFPLWMVFGWRRQLGVPDTIPKYVLFTVSLGTAGFLASLPGPLLGGMMLNVNLPTTRGIVFAAYAAFEDFSKAMGAFVVAALLPLVGSRDIAFQVCLLLWVLPGLALLVGVWCAEQDERAVEDAILESINEGLVRGSKERACRDVRNILSALHSAPKPALKRAVMPNADPERAEA